MNIKFSLKRKWQDIKATWINIQDCKAFYIVNYGKPGFHFWMEIAKAVYHNNVPDYYELSDTCKISPYYKESED